jgi:hypothetical protein
MAITAIRVRCKYNPKKSTNCESPKIKGNIFGHKKCIEFTHGLCQIREKIKLNTDEIIKEMEKDGYVVN